MSFVDSPERENVVRQALSATTIDEIAAATTVLRSWRDAHPDDVGIVDAFEQLEHMRLAAIEAGWATVTDRVAALS